MQNTRRSLTFTLFVLVICSVGAFGIPAFVSDRALLPQPIREFLGFATVPPAVSTGRDVLSPQADQFFAGDGSALTDPTKWGAAAGGPFNTSFVSGNTAVFAKTNGTGTGAVGITVGGVRAEESFTMNSPSGTLTTGGTVATVNVFAGKKLDLTGVAISTASGTGMNKTGAGELVITTGGAYSGGFTLTDGTMTAGGVNAMGGSGANVLNLNGGKLRSGLSTALAFANTKFGGGINFGGDFEIGAPASGANGAISFANNVSLGSSTRTITNSNTAATMFSGIISGSAGAGLTVTGNGTGVLTLSGSNTYTGPTTMGGSTLAVGTVANGSVASGLGQSTNAATNLVFDGGTLRYAGATAGSTNRNFTINAGKTAVIEVPGTSGDLTISGASSATTGGLTKTGTGLLNLSGQNLYSGNTTVSAGALVLVGSGSIANSPLIEIAGGAFFDVSVLTNPLTLSSGQSLKASGTTSTGTIATLSGKGLTTAGNSSLTFSAYNGVTAPLTIQGSGTVTLASTNSVTINTTTPLAANDYVIIAKGASGAVTGTAPTSLTIGGSGLAAGTIGSLQITGSQLMLHVAADTTAATDFFRSKQTGNWSAVGTWESSHDGMTWISATAAPTQNANTITIQSGHIVTVNTATTADQIHIIGGGVLYSPNGNLTVNDGTGDDITVDANAVFEIADSALQNNGQINVKGLFQIDEGAFVGSGTINYDQSTGTLVFNNSSGLYGIGVDEVYWRALNGPQNVTVAGAGGIDLHGARTLGGTFAYAAGVSGAANLTLNGTTIVNAGGFTSGSPTYGPSSLLKYSVDSFTPYGRNGEWLPDVTSGPGYPHDVELASVTDLNLVNGSSTSAFQLGGKLTIDQNATLDMTQNGGTGTNQPLTVLGLVELDGTLVLSNRMGGDLFVGGNWTRFGTGTLTPNGRRVTLNGAGAQSVNGNNTFDALSIVGTTARTVTFEAGKTQLVNSDLVVTGAAGNLLSLRSSSPGTQWKLHAPTQSSQDVNFVDVQDSDASGFSEVFALNSVNSGNNANWRFARPGNVQFSAARYSANENDGTVTITATRTGGSDGPIQVDFADDTGTATGRSGPACLAGDDYLQAGPGAFFSWGDGDSSDRSFELPLCNDLNIESDETVNLVLSNPTGGAALGTDSSVILTIHDDDAPQPTVGFSAAAYKGIEDSIAMITVTRSSSVGTGSVDFATSGGTATGTAGSCTIGGGNDYKTASGTLTFNDGETAKTFDVALCKDLLIEDPAETIGLTLSNPTGATLGAQSTATLTILDVANEFSNNTQIDLTNGVTPVVNYPSPIDVSGISGGVNGVRLSLINVNALDAHNIEVLLVSPDNRTFRAMAAVGGNFALTGATITLEDSAPTQMPQSAEITDGQNYRPASCADPTEDFPGSAPMHPYGEAGCTPEVADTFASVFGGVDPNGTWKLYVFEHQGQDRPTRNGAIPADGSIGGWGIQFLAPTAAPVSVSGRVLTAGGQGIRNAKVTISGSDLAEPKTMYTADFGYYYFSGLTAGQTYVITAEPPRYTISHPTRVVNLLDSLADFDFVADP